MPSSHAADRNRPEAAYTVETPYRLRAVLPPTEVIASQVLPETAVTQFADQGSPATVWLLTTSVPVVIVASTAAEVAGVPRRFTSQFAMNAVEPAAATG